MSLELAVCCVLGAWMHDAEAVPVRYGLNYYEFVAVADPFSGENNSWFTASAAASASAFNGVNGHLATITSQGENDFLLSLTAGNVTGREGAWIGGKSPEGWLAGPENGQPFTYVNWTGVEPNNAGYAYMVIGTTGPYAPGKWADDSFDQGYPDSFYDPVVGYFVEYENPGDPWFTIDGGGGESTNSTLGLGVTGTIGQLDAGRLTGCTLAIEGGFWGVISVAQTPEAPLLTITAVGNAVKVSWPAPSACFDLQENTDLSTSNWVTPGEPVQESGGLKFILVEPPTGNRFYRLFKP